MDKIIRIVRGPINLLKSAVAVILFSRLVRPIRTNKKNTKKQCVILGNGPSLNHVLTKGKKILRNKYLLCVNDFAGSPDFKVLKPRYYVLADPVFWSKDNSEKHKKRLEQCLDSMKTADWKMTLILPVAARKWNYFLNLPELNPRISIFYINTTEVYGSEKLRHFFYNLDLAMPSAQNVLVMSVFVTLKLGFRKIYLAGADHSWHENIEISKDNTLYMKYSRFYEKDKIEHQLFYEDPGETKPYQMYNLFRDLSRMFKSYIELEKYSKELNTKVYNISPKSFIDAFERLDINE
ncbi:MAG: hypothetical protein WC536_01665 [Patescibacteria group bacterium]